MVALAIAWLLLAGGGRESAIDAPKVARTAEGATEARPAEPPPPQVTPGPSQAPGPRPAAGRAPAATLLEALRTGYLAGRVVDDDGEPIEGARIRLGPMESAGESGEEETKTLFTDRDGAFRFEGLGTGPFLLLAKAERKRAALLRDLRPDADDLLVALPSQTGIAGRVLDAATGDAVARFRVEAHGYKASWRMRTLSRSFESSDGSFEFSNLE
ncbi:MAG: carboxypeptidase regulatory-like domain-containing protein, partial [Planctomycetota bacterium]